MEHVNRERLRDKILHSGELTALEKRFLEETMQQTERQEQAEVWVMENEKHPFVYCSGCGASIGTSGHEKTEFLELFRFCPCCGAKMRGIVCV